MLLMTSCGSDSNAKEQARQALGDTKTATQTAEGSATQNFHYKCPNDCVGGGGEGAGNCAVCGSPLVHNKDFHNGQGNSSDHPVTTVTDQGATVTQYPAGTPASAGMMPPSKADQEPAQNAKGVWHFTCAKGCAGGGGLASEKCGGCGGPLAHNAEYHAE